MVRLISVVIPTFNRKELTDQAIESVVSTFPELLEIVVVDDCGSTPYFYNAAANASGVPVQVFRLTVNGGAGMARKAGVERTCGEFIAFLDSDDRYDAGWMDFVISEIQALEASNRRLLISGKVNGERPAGALVRKNLATMPTQLRLAMSRVVAMFFNPLYAPSIVAHRELCGFRDGLRYCEDYYSTIIALFRADALLLPDVTACHLGREPNSAGGLSGAGKKMFLGEMEVRRALLALPDVPLPFKLLVPFGLGYQIFRVAAKRLLSLVRSLVRQK